jgi:dihydropteroate synthase
VSDVTISIDTRHAEVAQAAVEAGADIVNDVSGGTFDSQMLKTVAQMRVPMILMHMRGTPETMQQMTDYDDVVSDVAATLIERSRAAEQAGIPRWMQVLDPGIGFAKNLRGNLLLLQKMSTLRSTLRDYPILLGTSRKGFIGKIANETNPEARDFGTVASCVAALCLEENQGCNILRVHNVKGMKQAAMVMDAIKDAK